MKRFIAVFLVAIVVLSFFSSCSVPKEPYVSTPKKVLRIGVFEPYTGHSSVGGKKEIMGIRFANSESPYIDVDGESYAIELVYADNGSDVDTAITAAKQLVEENVSLVIGSYGSDVSMAAYQTFADAGIPIIGASCTHPDVTLGKDYYFRICFTDTFQGNVLSNFASDKFSAKKAYLLGEIDNEYDQGLLEYFSASFKNNGGSVLRDSFPKNNTDFTVYLENAVKFEADVIFLPVSISYGNMIIQQAKKMGLNIPILGSDTLDDSTILESMQGSQLSLYTSTFYQKGGNEKFDNAISKHLDENSYALSLNSDSREISGVSAMGYDAYYVAREAIKAANSVEPDDIKNALASIGYTGVSGSINFDSVNGDAIRNTVYIKKADVENNCWIFETKQEITAKK